MSSRRALDFFVCSLSFEFSKIFDEFGGESTCVQVLGGICVGSRRHLYGEGEELFRYILPERLDTVKMQLLIFL